MSVVIVMCSGSRGLLVKCSNPVADFDAISRDTFPNLMNSPCNVVALVGHVLGPFWSFPVLHSRQQSERDFDSVGKCNRFKEHGGTDSELLSKVMKTWKNAHLGIAAAKDDFDDYLTSSWFWDWRIDDLDFWSFRYLRSKSTPNN